MAFAYKVEQWMPCYHPLTGYYGKTVNPDTGRRPIVFSTNKAFSGVGVLLPCGWCVGCKLERSRVWAVRIMHEKRMHVESAFLTLTYRDKNLPERNSLVLRDLQLFMKRLRKQRETGLRFFACGEYGEVTRRPHYHVLLLNTCFRDQVFWKKSKVGHPLYVSAELSELWSDGDSYIGDVSFQSASYVAGYCTKKVLDKVCLPGRAPEFTCMSRRPGIGLPWLHKYKDEAYRSDSAIMDGRETKLPRYYDEKYEDINRERLLGKCEFTSPMQDWGGLKKDRRLKAQERREDSTPERLRVREKVDELNLERYKRENGYEVDSMFGV